MPRHFGAMAQLVLIAAVSADGSISTGRGVPWDLPADRAHFRARTLGRWLLLGHRTYLEMLGWFQPGHQALVLQRPGSPPLPPPGKAVENVEQALRQAAEAHQPELVVCGGAAAYTAAMPQAHRLIITHVQAFLGGGVRFPAISHRDWEPVSRQAHQADADHAHPFEIVTYHRVRRMEAAA